jgi:hypothetical protein
VHSGPIAERRHELATIDASLHAEDEIDRAGADVDRPCRHPGIDPLQQRVDHSRILEVAEDVHDERVVLGSGPHRLEATEVRAE